MSSTVLSYKLWSIVYLLELRAIVLPVHISRRMLWYSHAEFIKVYPLSHAHIPCEHRHVKPSIPNPNAIHMPLVFPIAIGTLSRPVQAPKTIHDACVPMRTDLGIASSIPIRWSDAYLLSSPLLGLEHPNINLGREAALEAAPQATPRASSWIWRVLRFEAEPNVNPTPNPTLSSILTGNRIHAGNPLTPRGNLRLLMPAWTSGGCMMHTVDGKPAWSDGTI